MRRGWSLCILARRSWPCVLLAWLVACGVVPKDPKPIVGPVDNGSGPNGGAVSLTSGSVVLDISPRHPDCDKPITFAVVALESISFELTVGAETKSTTDKQRDYTFGPFDGAPFANKTLPYRLVATMAGGMEEVIEGNIYIPNPKGHTCRAVPDGRWNGYPSRAIEQTGANLYRLDKPIVGEHALLAIAEYALHIDESPETVGSTADLMVEAVAYYVDKHMQWRSDTQNRVAFIQKGFAEYDPVYDFPQPADLTLEISGSAAGEFHGDCEDFAILRAALLRVQDFAPWAIWGVINSLQSHEYNVVLYNGAYRVMDYGMPDQYLTDARPEHESYFGWNEEHGPRTPKTPSHQDLKDNTRNFPGKVSAEPWNYKTYYKD